MYGYYYLILTIIFETAAIILMKMSDGTANKSFLLLGGMCYAATFILLTMALKYLPMGLTNAIWAGTSTFLVYLFGIVYFKDKTSFWEVVFILFIIVGLVGLNFISKTK